MSNLNGTGRVTRRKRALVPNMADCGLDQKVLLSGLTPIAITPAPTMVVVPLGPGHVLLPVHINDPGNYPAGDGHKMPGFEIDPGELPGDVENPNPRLLPLSFGRAPTGVIVGADPTQGTVVGAPTGALVKPTIGPVFTPDPTVVDPGHETFPWLPKPY